MAFDRWVSASVEPVRVISTLVAHPQILLSVVRMIYTGQRVSDGLQSALEADVPNEALVLEPTATPARVASALHVRQTELVRAWLGSATPVKLGLSHLADNVVRHAAQRLLVGFDILALGSYGQEELGLRSDVDLLFLIEASDPAADAQAEQFVAFFEGLRRHGSSLRLDVGTSQPTVYSYRSFTQYDLEGMELWERCALGNARLIHGNPEAVTLARKAAYALPLTPERLRELVKLRKTLQLEKVSQKHLFRHVKHGNGGLNDLEWIARLYELRYPTATGAGTVVRLPDRLVSLLRSGLMNAVEIEALGEAQRFLDRLRILIDLLGYQHNVLPENPDRLYCLAPLCGFDTGNELLAAFENHTGAVSSLYEETLERMHA